MRARLASCRKSLRVVRQVTKIQRGDAASFIWELTSARGTPVRGLVPAEVRVYGPDGSEVWEYGSNSLIENGVLQVQLKTAMNDAVGSWRMTVRDLCSGQTADAAFTLN